MPEYLYPGVYVEEVNTGNKPIEGVSTSTAGFLGIAERGPLAATFLTSFAEFQRTFGTYYTYKAGGQPAQAYLAFAVEGFFLNGGLRCWVARVTVLDTANNGTGAATTATATSSAITINASGPGLFGSWIGYIISPAGLSNANLFKLSIFYWSSGAAANSAMTAFNAAATAAAGDPVKLAAVLASTPNPAPAQIEIFDNLSADPNSSTYYVGAVNGGSTLVTVKAAAAGRPTDTNAIALLTKGTDGTAALAAADFQGVTAGSDPSLGPNNPPTGLEALKAVDDISLLCCPDESAISPRGTIAGRLEAACDSMKDRFAILESLPQEQGQPATVVPTVNSNYAAFYYPWLNVVSPTNGSPTLIPPGGHIAGIYARSDTNENVAKDPANEQILGISSLQLPINNELQAVLNPIGVNCLRYFKGQGNLVWGGRTTSRDPDWKYINVRRLFIYIEKSIQRGTQWVVFEPNDPTTWARVRRSVSDFLTGLWMQDMLMGATKDEAYFVRCDRTTMTQADIENGRLIVLVGVAPVFPAEFVIFRIGQWSGGSSVSEG
jgi:phage tail sheath protein FI